MLRIVALASDVDTKAEGTRGRPLELPKHKHKLDFVRDRGPLGQSARMAPFGRPGCPGCPMPGLSFHGTTAVRLVLSGPYRLVRFKSLSALTSALLVF